MAGTVLDLFWYNSTGTDRPMDRGHLADTVIVSRPAA